MEALTGWWDDFFWGTLTVIQLFFSSVVLMTIFGLVGAAAKLSTSLIAKKIAAGYTIVFRGTPEILVLLLMYYGAAISLTAMSKASLMRTGSIPGNCWAMRVAVVMRARVPSVTGRVMPGNVN
jgi:ABC-type arginine transport system permease subunit